MSAIKSMLAEVRYELLKVVILDSFLDATILFLALLLVLGIFGIGIMLCLLIALLFLFIDGAVRWRRLNLVYIEDRNPAIREMLRTAADNRDSESLMAQALFADLIRRMRNVSSGTFVSFRRLGAKVAILFVLSLALVGLAFFNVNIQKFENPFNGLRDRMGGLGEFLGGATPETNVSDATDDIYGEPSIARLGNDQLDVQLQQSLNQIDFNKVGAAEDLSGEVPDSYPADVGAQASQAYAEGLEDITDRKTASDYSQRIKK